MLMLYMYISFMLIFVLFIFFLLNNVAVDIELLKVLPPILPIFLIVALFTLFESKMLASMQSSRGPNVVGLWGLLQPFADAFKLMFKETIIPGLSNLVLFMLAPIFTFMLSLLSWAVVPFDYGIVLSDINLGLMFLLAVSSLGVYGIVISGWSSNSKYAFLGSLSSAAQFVSYEVSIGLILMMVLMIVNSLNMTMIVDMQFGCWFLIALWPCFLLFFIASLAETNSIPFDLPEAESELVSGYNVEYAATTFVLFFLAEYSNILIMCILLSIFFLGGWLPLFTFTSMFFFMPAWIWFSIKILMFVYLFMLVSATLPRYRYDQLMSLGWKVLLPFALAYFFFVSVVVWLFF